MYANDSGAEKDPERPDAKPFHTTECPQCGVAVTAISTSGPSRHTLEPCGHDVGPLTARDLANTHEPQLVTDGGEDTVRACPECDSTAVTRINHHPSGISDHDKDYYCGHCNSFFDEFVRRPKKNDSDGLSGLARRLAKADPDDVTADSDRRLVTDGGRIDPLACPRGHHSVKLSAHRFRCATCRNQGRETTSWPRSELVDLREETPPLADEETKPKVVTDGGHPNMWRSLTGFKRDLLEAIQRIENRGTTPYGTGIKEALEDEYGKEINHGRLYPNLDEFVDRGLVEKGQIDRRTNSYELTLYARKMLRERAQTLADICDVSQAVADGGEHA